MQVHNGRSACCDYEHPKVTKTMVAREKAEAKMQRVVARTMPSDEQFNGLRVLVDDSLRSVAFDNAAMHLGWTFVRESKDAKVFVVQNPAEMDDETTLAASLCGGWVMTPDTLVRRSGACIKFKESLQVRRKVFVTDAFKTEHPSIAALLEAKVEDNSAWKLIEDVQSFADLKGTATRNKCPATVIALIGDHEGHIFANVQHCFAFVAFLEFVNKIDKESSTFT